MIGSGLGENFNCFATVGEEPSPTSDSFSFVTLKDHLVVGFLEGIVPAIETNCFKTMYRETLDKTHILSLRTKNLDWYIPVKLAN